MDIKICGATSREEIEILDDEGVGYVGLWTGVTGHPRNLGDFALKLLAGMCRRITPVAVCVRRPVREVHELLAATNVSHVQLHGFNLPGDIAFLKRKGYSVIKTLHISDAGEAPEARWLDAYDAAETDIYLIDRHDGGGGIGSTGRALDPAIAGHWAERLAGRRIWLAGGLTAPRISEIARRSPVEAVDIDSAAREGALIARSATRALVSAARPMAAMAGAVQ